EFWDADLKIDPWTGHHTRGARQRPQPAALSGSLTKPPALPGDVYSGTNDRARSTAPQSFAVSRKSWRCGWRLVLAVAGGVARVVRPAWLVWRRPHGQRGWRRGGAERTMKPLAVLPDFGLDGRIHIAIISRPGAGAAERGDAVLRCPLQNQGE